MSQLIPVQRVDKNGKTVTRHVKMDSIPTGQTKIPALNQNVPTKNTVNDLFELMESSGEVVVRTAQTREANKVLIQENPLLQQTLTSLIAKGDDTASKAVLSFLVMSHRALAFNIVIPSEWEKESYRFGNSTSSRDAYYEELYKGEQFGYSQYDMPLQKMLGVRWAAVSLNGEENASDLCLKINRADDNVYYGQPEHKSLDDQIKHWRGLAALVLTESYHSDSDVDDKTFVEWASNHEDLPMVLHIAKEHSIRDIDVIEDFVQQANVARSLTAGIL